MVRIGKILYLPWMIWMIWIPNKNRHFAKTHLRSFVRRFVKIEHKRHVQSFSLIQRWVKRWEVQKVGIGMVTNVWWQVWQGDENTSFVSIFFHLFLKKWRTCANVHSNNWRCVPCKMDLIMKWNISKCPVLHPVKFSSKFSKLARWWIQYSSMGSPLLIKVPWVYDFADTKKMWFKSGLKRIRESHFFLGWNGTLGMKNYIYLRFKVER